VSRRVPSSRRAFNAVTLPTLCRQFRRSIGERNRAVLRLRADGTARQLRCGGARPRHVAVDDRQERRQTRVGLGVKLFHRTTRRVNLTADGERFVQKRCERVLAEVEDLRAEAAGVRATPSGTLRVDLPITYGRRIVMPLLAGMVHRHPDLKLDVRLQDSCADIVRDGLDLAIRAGALHDSTLVARRIDWQQLIVVASPGYLAARGTPKRIADMPSHDVIAFRQPTSGRARPWQLRQGGRQVELHPEPRAQVNDAKAWSPPRQWASASRRSPTTWPATSSLAATVVEVMASFRPAAMPISAVMPSSRLLPPRVRVLLETLETLRKRKG
jgi:DNA-binding transcriptional LysR family regulator